MEPAGRVCLYPLWKLIGTLIKRKTKGQTTPLRIVRNNKTYINNDDIADQFNKHFVNVGPYLASKIANSNVNPTHYISFSPTSSFVMSTVTETQVSSLFETLDANKSSIDIPNKLIKLAAGPLSVPFTKIYNQSIETGIVPNVLKVSQVPQFTKMVMSLTQVTTGLSQLSRLLVKSLKG